MPLSEIKTNMNQNTSRTQCRKSKRPNNQTPNTCAHQAKVAKHNSKQPSTEHMYTCIFGPWATAHSIWSQSSHHMRSVNFYHTIVHDNDSVNEMVQDTMLQINCLGTWTRNCRRSISVSAGGKCLAVLLSKTQVTFDRQFCSPLQTDPGHPPR